MATLIPLLGYGLGPIPIPALPLGEINGGGVALQASLLALLGLLLVAVLVHWEIVSALRRSGHGDT
jgi:hypothetical protein